MRILQVLLQEGLIGIWHRVKAGQISAVKMGGRYFIDASVLTKTLTEENEKQIEAGIKKITTEYKDLLEWLSKE